SLRPTEAFHSRRNHSLGRIAGGGIGGQRPRSRHSSIRRKRLHCAGWRCHAHQTFGVRRTVLLTKVEQTQLPVFSYHPPRMHPFVLSILLGLTAAAANIFGGAIIVQKHWERSYLKYFVALGAGFMLATAMVEIFPESLRLQGDSAAYLVLLGYLIIHFFEHTVSPHFHFGEETHAAEFVHARKGYSVLLGLLIHTFFDGIAIASGFIVSNWLGWVIFLAVFLHKIPEGFTVASVMLASGRSRG